VKKIFLMFFAVFMVFVNAIPSFASAESTELNTDLQKIRNLDVNQELTIQIIKDNKQQRVVEVFEKDTGKIYRSIFNKKDNSFETVEIDKKTKIEKNVFSSKTFETQYNGEQLQSSQISSMSFSLIDSGSNLSGKFKYYVYTQKIWVVQCEGKSKNPTETSNNSSDLQSFRNSVNNLRGAELRFSAAMGAAATSTLIAAITAPTGWGPIVATLTAVGAGAAAIAEAYNSYVYAKDCRFYFGRITIR